MKTYSLRRNKKTQFLKDGIRILSRAIQLKEEDLNLDFEYLNLFVKGLELLDDHDHENLDKKGLSKRKASYAELSDYQEIIRSMRSDFKSGLFGKEKDGSYESVVYRSSKVLV